MVSFMSPALLQFLCDRTKLDKFSVFFLVGRMKMRSSVWKWSSIIIPNYSYLLEGITTRMKLKLPVPSL